MKPKKLPYPFSWSARHPLFKEGVFYVPDYYDKHDLWEGGHPFIKTKTFIEYCSGNGEWILEQAAKDLTIHWIAVEKDFERVRKIVAKRDRRNLTNVTVVSGIAEIFTEHYLPEASIDAVFMNFPDPWPKDRHAKHRLVKAPFVDELERVMKKEAVATFVTDDTTYSEQMQREMLRVFKLQSLEPIEGYGSSFFERLWKDKGRDIHFMRYAL